MSGVAPNMCADVWGAGTTPGTPVTSYTCHGGTNQQWTLQPSGALTVYGGTLCLDIYGARGNDGDPVVVWTCNGQANQKWTQTAAGELVGMNGKCLDVAGANAAPGTRLIVWSCWGGTNQKWTFANAVPSVGVSSSSAVGSAELPRVLLNTAMPTATGQTIAVPSGGDLQGALDAARPGDQIVLAPGATYVGNFILPVKTDMSAGQWITVRTAGVLPAEGTRVGPGDAGQMPKILTPNAAAAIATAPGTQGWRFTGIEIGLAPGGYGWTYTIVTLGTSGADQSTLAQVPSRLVIDRSYVHGTATSDVRRCIALNSASTAVIDSYVSDCHSRNGDAQAVQGFNGPGPFKIVNNHLEGSHENIAFGGSDPTIAGLIPSDIEIRRNHVLKPLAWKGVWTAKNLFELKAGQRLLIEANVFENSWQDGQNGFGFLWQTTNQDGGCTWCATSDVTFRYNVVRGVAGGFNLSTFGSGSTGQVNPAIPFQRVTIANNVITGVGADGTNGRLYQLLGNVAGLTIVNNSGFGTVHDFLFGTPDQPVPTLVFRDNITGAQYNFFASGVGLGAAGLAGMQVPASNVTGNVIATPTPGNVPPNNTAVASPNAIGFANLASGDLTLVAGSPYLSAGTGRTRPGADVAQLTTMVQGVVK